MSVETSDLTDLNDYQYWNKTVGSVGQELDACGREYVPLVMQQLAEWGVQADRETISNVRRGRVKGNRTVAKAIWQVGLKLKNTQTK